MAAGLEPEVASRIAINTSTTGGSPFSPGHTVCRVRRSRSRQGDPLSQPLSIAPKASVPSQARSGRLLPAVRPEPGVAQRLNPQTSRECRCHRDGMIAADMPWVTRWRPEPPPLGRPPPATPTAFGAQRFSSDGPPHLLPGSRPARGLDVLHVSSLRSARTTSLERRMPVFAMAARAAGRLSIESPTP